MLSIGQIIIITVVSAVTSGVTYLLVSYLKEKGKNLATKEDIGAITKEVEAVRAIFVREIEDRKAVHQLRSACIDKRLEVHQEAYTRWIQIARSSQINLGQFCAECEDWWVKNCLYLERDASRAFFSTFRLAPGQTRLLNGNQHDMYETNARTISEAGGVIAQAVGLPAIKDVIPEVKPDANSR